MRRGTRGAVEGAALTMEWEAEGETMCLGDLVVVLLGGKDVGDRVRVVVRARGAMMGKGSSRLGIRREKVSRKRLLKNACVD